MPHRPSIPTKHAKKRIAAIPAFASHLTRVYQSTTDLQADPVGLRRMPDPSIPEVPSLRATAFVENGRKLKAFLMTDKTMPTDLDLSALVASKICHDVIGPVGAIYNGLEILDEDDDADAQSYALEVIRNVTKQASARLQFARFAFGASGSAGAQIDLAMAQQISEGFVGDGKHKLTWVGQPGHMEKNKVKLLLNLIAISISALPRGGEITSTIVGDLTAPEFELVCRGAGARAPQHLTEFVSGQNQPPLDALSIQAYYTWRLANTAEMALQIFKNGDDIVLAARNAAAVSA